MPSFFIDTNVLIYSVSADAWKADRAEALLGSAGGWISVQVLNEACRVLHDKQKRAWPEIRGFLDRAQTLLQVTPLTFEMHRTGLDIAERHRLSIFDSMIVAAALHCGCETLYSEDMHDGLVVDGRLTIANPFAAP